VRRYKITGQVAELYLPVKLSNEEIANFLIFARDEQEALDRIKLLYSWFCQETEWEPQNP